MTSSATMLHLNAASGPHAVTFYLFLITMAPALFARTVLSQLQGLPVGRVWALGTAVQILTLGVLLPFSSQQALLLAGLGFIAVWQNVAASSFTPLLNQLVEEGQRGRVITMTSSIPSLSMVFGSLVSAVVLSRLGLVWLLSFQGLAFLLALLLLPWWGAAAHGTAPSIGKRLSNFRVPTGIERKSPLIVLFALWVSFSVFGVAVDAVEMPVLTSFHGLSVEQTGLWLSLYGFGGLAVFMASTVLGFSPRSFHTGALLAAGALLWVLVPGLGLVGFVLAGLGYSLMNAALRTRINEAAEASGAKQQDVWAWFFQYSLLVSGSGFALSTVFYAFGGSYHSLVFVLVAICVFFLAGVFRAQRVERAHH